MKKTKTTDDYRRKIKGMLIEVMEDSVQRRGSMLSPEVIAALLDLSYRSIYRLKNSVLWLPRAEICPAIERFCQDVIVLREKFGRVVRHWDACELSKLDKIAQGCLFKPSYLSVLKAKDLTANERAEQFVILVLRDYAKELQKKREGQAEKE